MRCANAPRRPTYNCRRPALRALFARSRALQLQPATGRPPAPRGRGRCTFPVAIRAQRAWIRPIIPGIALCSPVLSCAVRFNSSVQSNIHCTGQCGAALPSRPRPWPRPLCSCCCGACARAVRDGPARLRQCWAPRWQGGLCDAPPLQRRAVVAHRRRDCHAPCCFARWREWQCVECYRAVDHPSHFLPRCVLARGDFVVHAPALLQLGTGGIIIVCTPLLYSATPIEGKHRARVGFYWVRAS